MSDQFLCSGTCPVPLCQVTLRLEDGSCLFACKHRLSTCSNYFRGHFYANHEQPAWPDVRVDDPTFNGEDDKITDLSASSRSSGPSGGDNNEYIELDREDNDKPVPLITPSPQTSTVIKTRTLYSRPRSAQSILSSTKIPKRFRRAPKRRASDELVVHGISKEDLLLFLRCAAAHETSELHTIQSDARSLCILISLADQWECPQLKVRIYNHLISAAMANVSSLIKMALVTRAYQHRAGCKQILEACVRLCATLNLEQLQSLHDKIGAGAMASIYSLIAQAKIPSVIRRSPVLTIKYDDVKELTVDKHLLMK